MIVDANAHLGPSLHPDHGFEHASTIDALLARMEAAGIDRAVVSPLTPPSLDLDAANRRLAETIADRDAFIGIARVDPRVSGCAERARRALADDGLRGLKLHPGEEFLAIGDPRIESLLDVAGTRGVPVWIHAGRQGVADALAIRDLALKFPSVPIVVIHAAQRNVSGLGVPDALLLAQQTGNTYFETSGVYRQDLIRDLVETVGPERVVFGTNAPYFDPRLEITRITRSTLDPAIQSAVLQNIAQLVGSG